MTRSCLLRERLRGGLEVGRVQLRDVTPCLRIVSECFVFGCEVDCKDASFCVWAVYCCRVCVASTRRGSKGNELEARC